MKVQWLASGLKSLADIQVYIAERNPRVAVAVRSAIRRAANQLADFPHAGRTGLIPETRELIVNKHPYIIVYRVIGSTVEILRVHHDATNWMGGP